MRAALILASAVALAGCGGGDPIVLIDGGVRTDTGTSPTDGGGGGGTDAGTDAGGGGGTCGTVNAAAGFPALPDTCMPRCTAATLMTVAACTGTNAGMCQQTAVGADTTASVLLGVGGGMTQEIDCAGCFNWQIQSCIFDSCPTEIGAFNTCAAMGTPETANTRCATELMAVNTCAMTNMATVQPCVNMRAIACFNM